MGARFVVNNNKITKFAAVLGLAGLCGLAGAVGASARDGRAASERQPAGVPAAMAEQFSSQAQRQGDPRKRKGGAQNVPRSGAAGARTGTRGPGAKTGTRGPGVRTGTRTGTRGPGTRTGTRGPGAKTGTRGPGVGTGTRGPGTRGPGVGTGTRGPGTRTGTRGPGTRTGTRGPGFRDGRRDWTGRRGPRFWIPSPGQIWTDEPPVVIERVPVAPPPGPAVGALPPDLEKIFDNGNVYAVQNAPTRETTFTLKAPMWIAKITNYHWNNGRGAAPGKIGLRNGAGEIVGPWQTTGRPGQGGVPDAYWVAEPDTVLPAGTYTVLDSDAATWAQNAASDGAGMVTIEGGPAD
jgi:hypothetical protein